MYQFYAQTVKGLKSQQNDDCFLVNDVVCQNDVYKTQSQKNDFIIAVADGVGSTEKGYVASKFLLEQIAKQRSQLSHAIILNIIHNTHAYLKKEFQSNASAVFTIVYASNNLITVYHVGDTRAYKLTAHNNLIQLTNDHTYIQSLIDKGVIGENMRNNHPQKNLITQCIGGEKDIQVDIYRNSFEPGEKLILSSDGIHDYLTQKQIKEKLISRHSLQSNVSQLIDLAISNGSKDDLTMITVKYI